MQTDNQQLALEAHHTQARKILLSVKEQLGHLESGKDTSIQLQANISQQLNTLARELHAIEELMPAVNADKRAIWQKRVKNLRDESACERGALDKFASRMYAQQQQAEERAALLKVRRERVRSCDPCAIPLGQVLLFRTSLSGTTGGLPTITSSQSKTASRENRRTSTLPAVSWMGCSATPRPCWVT